jgi:transposase
MLLSGMISAMENLPDNIDELREIIREITTQSQREIECLKEQISLLRAKIFGRRTEKYDLEQLIPGQSFLPGLESDNQIVVTEPETVVVEKHTRKKTGRKPLPDNLPREDVIHDIPEEEKVCDCGCRLTCIGEEVSEQLHVEPAKYKVIRNIRLKYACRGCEGVESDDQTVKIAPPPVQLIPKSFATVSLLIYIIASKFIESLPLYRQEKRFRRYGITLTRATMSNWLIKVAVLCQPLLPLMQQEIRSGPLINADESTFQVMKEPNRKNTSKSYIWVFRGGLAGKPLVVFHYEPSRAGQVAYDFLEGYHGYVQTDGYQGYNILEDNEDITLMGCLAHARRKFDEVLKANRKSGNKKKLAAEVALEYIRKLYALEKEAKELTPDERYLMRQEKAKPIMDAFGDWLRETYPQTPPKGLLGKAIKYTLNQWSRLTVYLENGILRPDNNLAENAIRPFVIGRKNWLFAGSPEGAQASALFYSLIETAKINNLNPEKYLRFLLEKIIHVKEQGELLDLLPNRVSQETIDKFMASPNHMP